MNGKHPTPTTHDPTETPQTTTPRSPTRHRERAGLARTTPPQQPFDERCHVVAVNDADADMAVRDTEDVRRATLAFVSGDSRRSEVRPAWIAVTSRARIESSGEGVRKLDSPR